MSVSVRIQRQNQSAVESAGAFFRQLLASTEFAEFALILKRLTGLSMALNTPGVDVIQTGVRGDSGNPVCKLIRDTAEGRKRCERCDREHHARSGAEGKARLYVCHAGFHDMAIPIIVQGEHVATISSGQVLTERHSAAGFLRMRKRLHWLKVSDVCLRHAYRKAIWLPRERLRYVMRLLEICARQMFYSAWRIHELEAAREHPAIYKARAHIETHFGNANLCLSEVADISGLSPAHFSHVFHHKTGLTFSGYVQLRRIEEAKHLLLKTDLNITEICFACGFGNLTHFNRVFRRSADCSPSQFRHAQQKKHTRDRRLNFDKIERNVKISERDVWRRESIPG